MRFLFFLFIIFNFHLSAQMNFEFTWGNEKIENFKRYPLNNNDWIEFSELKIYLSNYILSEKNHTIELNSVDLIDNENTDSKVILDSINPSSFESLTFNIGLDSVINTSGILLGDLDPINGMYWAWNSGYIHLKMIGKSSLVNAAKNEFEFHLGGYRKPNETCFKVTLPIGGNTVKLDLKPLFLNHIELNNTALIMIPGAQAKKIMQEAVKLFSTE